MSIDRNGEIIVDTAVIDYEFDDRYIVAARVAVEWFTCNFAEPSSNEGIATVGRFIDRVDYLVIDKHAGKSNSVVRVFESSQELHRYLENSRYSGKGDLDITDKERLVRLYSHDQIDRSRCHLAQWQREAIPHQ